MTVVDMRDLNDHEPRSVLVDHGATITVSVRRREGRFGRPWAIRRGDESVTIGEPTESDNSRSPNITLTRLDYPVTIDGPTEHEVVWEQRSGEKWCNFPVRLSAVEEEGRLRVAVICPTQNHLVKLLGRWTPGETLDERLSDLSSDVDPIHRVIGPERAREIVGRLSGLEHEELAHDLRRTVIPAGDEHPALELLTWGLPTSTVTRSVLREASLADQPLASD